MTFSDRLLGSLKAIVLLLLAFPIAVAATFVTGPFWKWLDGSTNIESYGHSGPAEWCYLAMYTLIVLLIVFLWAKLDRKRGRS
jgi:hypothetical protein